MRKRNGHNLLSKEPQRERGGRGGSEIKGVRAKIQWKNDTTFHETEEPLYFKMGGGSGCGVGC